MRNRSFILFVVLVFSAFTKPLFGQEPEVEKLLERDAEMEDNSELEDYLNALRMNPMDLNKVTLQQLQTLPWLTPRLAKAVIRLRQKGPFSHLDDLLQINGIDAELLQTLAPFVTVQKTWRIPAMEIWGQHRFSRRMERSRGYETGVYPGHPGKFLNRVGGQVGEIFHYGLVLEKDRGESRWDDYTAWFGRFTITNWNTSVFVGRLGIESGQGLVFSSVWPVTKLSDPIIPVKRRSRGIYPFRSSDENAGLDGIAISTQVSSFTLQSYYSEHLLDASIVKDSVVALPLSGYHRTESERVKKDALLEKSLGAIADWNPTDDLNVGVSYRTTVYDHPFATSALNPLDLGEHIFGIHVDAQVQQWNAFGEWARCATGAASGIAGILFSFPNIDLAVLARNYHPDFYNRLANSFGENDRSQNERGWYWGWRWRFAPRSTLAFYFDQFKFPWQKYRIPMPTNGFDWMATVETRPNKNLTAALRLKVKSVQTTQKVADQFGNSITRLAEQTKTNVRLQLDWRLPRTVLQGRTRFEQTWSRYDSYGQPNHLPLTTGWLLLQDLRINVPKKLSLATRYLFFDAPAFESALYAYETDGPGFSKIKLLYGQGHRYFTVLTWKPIPQCHLSGKYELTIYRDKDYIGSGYDRTVGNRESSITLQLDWAFE